MAGIINALLNFLLMAVIICLDGFLDLQMLHFSYYKKEITTYDIRRVFSNYMMIVINRNQQEGIRYNYKLNIEKEKFPVYEVVYRTIKYYKI